MFKIDAMPELSNIKYPVRIEALNMIRYLFINFEQNSSFVKLFIEFISTDKFIENERKLIQISDNILLIESSIELMNLILYSSETIDDGLEKRIRAMISSIK